MERFKLAEAIELLHNVVLENEANMTSGDPLVALVSRNNLIVAQTLLQLIDNNLAAKAEPFFNNEESKGYVTFVKSITGK